MGTQCIAAWCLHPAAILSSGLTARVGWSTTLQPRKRHPEARLWKPTLRGDSWFLPSASRKLRENLFAKRLGSRTTMAALPAVDGKGGRAPLVPSSEVAVGADGAYTLAVLGDLHLEPGQMDLFRASRQQVIDQLAPPGGAGPVPGARVVQLGDLGGYSCFPGSWDCFHTAHDFLSAFPHAGVPAQLITGNHDLEGMEFDTDAENLAAWQAVFGQHHYWRREAGETLLLGLSTVRHREAKDSNHEVHIDDEQLVWFEDQLKESKGRPVLIFSHAPPMGSGLTSLLEVHVRNGCAWLNHSDKPHRFLELVRAHPNIRLWFSGHYHLSHDYERSVSLVNNCLFVQTGVMGNCHRDGRRHSRVLRGSDAGYRLFTLDHETGEMREDVALSYKEEGAKPSRLWCSVLQAATSCSKGGLFSPSMPRKMDDGMCDLFSNTAITATPASKPYIPAFATYEAADLVSSPADVRVQWLTAGPLVFALCNNRLVEYDAATGAALGVVADAVDGREIRFVMEGDQVEAIELCWPQSLLPAVAAGLSEGGDAAYDLSAEEEDYKYQRQPGGMSRGAYTSLTRQVERIERNSANGFWQVFQHNRWHLKRIKAREAARAIQAKSGDTPVIAL